MGYTQKRRVKEEEKRRLFCSLLSSAAPLRNHVRVCVCVCLQHVANTHTPGCITDNMLFVYLVKCVG